MAKNYVKRKVDAHMHRDPAFRALPFKIREALRVIIGEVDYLGLWPMDIDNLCLWVGKKVTLQELQDQKVLTIQIINDGKSIFLPGFVEFTCGDKSGLLNPKNSYHAKVGKDLAALGLPSPKFKEIPQAPPGGTPPPTIGGAVNKNTNTHSNKPKNKNQTQNQTAALTDEQEAEQAKEFARKLELEDAAEFYRSQAKRKLKLQIPPFLKAKDLEALEQIYDDPDMTLERLKKLINAYVWMDNKWFDTCGRDLPTMAKNLNQVLMIAASTQEGASA